ncbi:PP2C family protein-serine/threonine phosphatase [Quadrisphaera oryzae]|uniref:PP2C family protein-serine/threonine phosphatase n=1 Tax=Quadrisphaera sp. RL12-1S TaxID=2763011 RepID=UPI00351C3216
MRRLNHACGSVTGRRRSVNEDGVLAAWPVFAVADGMGGHADGAAASSSALAELAALTAQAEHHSLTPDDVLSRLGLADDRVRALAGDGDEEGPGTTLAAVVALQLRGRDYWMVLNVGDSRVYRLAGGLLEQVSVDHSLVQELVDAGDLVPGDARRHAQRHVVTRALGAPGASGPDCWLVPMTGGDRLLLCSDGVTSVVDDVEVARLLREHAQPDAALAALLGAVTQRSGPDDASAVVVDVSADDNDLDGLDASTRPRAAAAPAVRS